jgi:ribose 5-phosphate isomerase RpiB
MSSCKFSIALGCDEAAYNLKETVRSYLEKQGHTIKDYGVYNTEPSSYVWHGNWYGHHRE